MRQNAGSGSAITGQGSKTQAARQGATQTGQRVSQAGNALAHNTAAQGRDVASEASRQARELMGQASSQLKEQAGTQQQHAAHGLRTLGEQLRTMSERSDQPGLATDLIRHTADRVQQAAQWLDQRDPGMVISDVRDYARRKPGAFLAGAAVAGMLVGRLTKGLTGRQDGGDGQHPADPRAATPAHQPSDSPPPDSAPEHTGGLAVNGEPGTENRSPTGAQTSGVRR